MSFRGRNDLPVGQLYDSRYSPVQTRYNYEKSIQKLHKQIKRQKEEEFRKLKEEEKARKKDLEAYDGKYKRLFWRVWEKTFAKLGDDWVFLAVLGILVALISYSIDKGVLLCLQARGWLYSELAEQPFSKWVAWCSLPLCLILWDVGLTSYVAPQAAGSGIPQIKTCLRGVFMKEVLTYKTLLVKWLGITATIGSGLPLGKEGPLIHMSSIIVTKMGKALSSFNKVFINESKKIEMLGAAWAVGVACTFNAPIGGVLFSVEITTAYYAVRNYWRGFFTAVWGATVYRLLLVWIDGANTITVVFPTSFYLQFPYDPLELVSFAVLGLICGLGGSLYVFCKQTFSNWAKDNVYLNKIKKTNQFIYPCFVILLVSTVQWPPGSGRFMAAHIPAGAQVVELFSNFTWTDANITIGQQQIVDHWTTDWTGVYSNLVIYAAYQFIFSIVSSSLPVPNGSFIPNFRCGAAMGRIAGELLHLWFPLGVRYRGKVTQIIPGAYATVGAAAFSGAVTHTMSVCVILFEMTSQITHVIPVLIAVLIANGVARLLTPSIYDLVILSNKLPYLPDLLPNTSGIYDVLVEDFMVKNVQFVYLGMSYNRLRHVLITNKKLKVFPLVDHPENMTLLGSIPRVELVILIDMKVGAARRREALPGQFLEVNDGLGSSSEIGRSPEVNLALPRIEDSDDSGREEKESKKQQIFKKWSWDRRKKAPSSPMPNRRSASFNQVQVSVFRICDLPPDKQKEWEEKQLKDQVDFATCRIDPAPFQLVERTSLLKVHSLFSMLAINFAYVTSIGRLVGVVGLKELRKAIEDANSGNPPKRVLRPPASPLPFMAHTPIMGRSMVSLNVEHEV